MRRRKIDRPNALITALLVAVAELVSTERSLAQTTVYAVAELSATVNGGHVPCRLNNLGDIAGRAGSSIPGQTRAMIWTHGTLQSKSLGASLGGEYSSASAINDAGEVVGGANTLNSIVPFIWTLGGGLRRVPLLPGDKCGQALSINKYGHVAGYSSGIDGSKAFLWTRKAVRNLGSLPGGNYSRARAVNDSDEVVGTSASPAGDHAVLWTRIGNVRDLGTLPGDTSSEGIAINNARNVVGYSKGPGGPRAFLWTEATGMQDLGVLAGGHSSQALDINDSGQVVGSSSTSSFGDRAFVWTKQAGMTDLNSASSAQIGVIFFEAHGINSRGEILAMGINTHESGMMGDMASGVDQMCAPGPPASFLLTPTTTP